MAARRRKLNRGDRLWFVTMSDAIEVVFVSYLPRPDYATALVAILGQFGGRQQRVPRDRLFRCREDALNSLPRRLRSGQG